MKANSIELLKDAYGGTFEENVKTVLTKHFDSDSAENLWNQIVEKYSKLFQKLNISEEDEDAVYYILPSVERSWNFSSSLIDGSFLESSISRYKIPLVLKKRFNSSPLFE